MSWQSHDCRRSRGAAIWRLVIATFVSANRIARERKNYRAREPIGSTQQLLLYKAGSCQMHALTILLTLHVFLAIPRHHHFSYLLIATSTIIVSTLYFNGLCKEHTISKNQATSAVLYLCLAKEANMLRTRARPNPHPTALSAFKAKEV